MVDPTIGTLWPLPMSGIMERMFDHFTVENVAVENAVLHVRYGGDGPPVLLLHGHPRTGATWHKVAPRLVAAGYSVVCPDLRGYGRSSGPAPTADHSAHSKRAVAKDMAQLMTALGHDRFHLVGHDRGSYVALRLALDHEHRVDHLALLDCVPISEHLSRADARFATMWWHWFFYAQPDTPERVIFDPPTNKGNPRHPSPQGSYLAMLGPKVFWREERHGLDA
jgi:haloacetate dehalogenase